jgi:hypothetical protein
MIETMAIYCLVVALLLLLRILARWWLVDLRAAGSQLCYPGLAAQPISVQTGQCDRPA